MGSKAASRRFWRMNTPRRRDGLEYVRTYIECQGCGSKLRGLVALSSSAALEMPVLVCPKCGQHGALNQEFSVGPQVLHERLREEVGALLEIEIEVENESEMETLVIQGKRHKTMKEKVPEKKDKELEYA